MRRSTLLIAMIAAAFAVSAQATGFERAAVAAPPPVEPSNLFTIPTGQVVPSMDLAISGSGILFGESAAAPLIGAVLGLGDIAQMDLGTVAMVSSLRKPNQLIGVPAAGLKVYLPLWRYAQGVAVSFHRTGMHKERVHGSDYETRLGEFYTVATLANFANPSEAAASSGGWKGVKMKGHLGTTYIDAQLSRSAFEIKQSYWRPVGGFEVWKDDARARIVGELSWSAGFNRGSLNDEGGDIEIIRVAMGGVRFFFSKHVTFDIGIRHQDNYGGIAESTIQTKLHMALPTQILQDRIVGN